MADTKIKDIAPKTPVVATDELVINDVAGCNVDKKIGLDDLKTYTSLSPSLVTPALGTPASGVLTNATGLPTAGILDNAVTLGKMAGGTDGNLITYDASGDPAAVATGTAAQVLTSNGVGAAPTFQAAGGGGFTILSKACDQGITCDSTLTTDCCLQFCADACSKYIIMYQPLWTSHATPDFKYAWTLPTNATGSRTNGVMRSDSELPLAALTDVDSYVNTACIAEAVQVWGFVKTGACSGVVGFQWAQNTSSCITTTLKACSFVMYKKL